MARTKCPAYVVRNPSGVVQTTATYFVYNAGGVVEADVYAAESGGSPLAQPINVDGQARIIFYADAGVYDIHVTVGGDTTTTENVQLGEFQQYSPDDIPGPVTIDGTVAVGDGSAAALLVLNGVAGQNRDLAYRTAGVNRWLFRANVTAESGSNAGSDFQVLRRDDAGASLGVAVSINRATGYFAVGDAAAGVKLEANHAGALQIRAYNTTNGTDIRLGADTDHGFLNMEAAAMPLIFKLQSTEAARFAPTTRNFLIGTTTDDGTNKLQVAGSAAVSTSVKTPLVTNAGTLDLSATGANAIILTTNGTEALRVTSAQRVGAGTNTPTSPVHVAGAASIDTTGSTGKWTIKAQDTTTSAAGVGGGVLFSGNKSAAGAVGNFGGIAGVKENGTNNNEQGALVMYTTPSSGVMVEAARISSNQRFLIGTTTDDGSNLLQVNGNTALMGQTLTLGGTTYNGVINNFASIRININSDASGSGEHFTVGKDQTTMSDANVLFRVLQAGRALFNTATDDGANAVQVNGSGYISSQLGIGATPTRTLTVDSGASSTNAVFTASGIGGTNSMYTFTSGTGAGIFDAPASGGNGFYLVTALNALVMQTNGSESARILDGRVLINTTSNDAVGRLQVNGPITHSPGASVTPANNGQITFEFTDNTTLTFKGKGSDGTVRTATLTLA